MCGGDRDRRQVLRAVVMGALGGGGVVATGMLPASGSGAQDLLDGWSSPDGGREIGLWAHFAAVTVPDGVDLVRSSGYASPGLGRARYALDPDQGDGEPTPFRRRSANRRWFRIAEPAISYTMAGARGDGQGGIDEKGHAHPVSGSDDTAAIQRLYDYLAALGGGTALVDPMQFNVTGLRLTGSGIRTRGLGMASHVHTIAGEGRPAVFLAGSEDRRLRQADLHWENLRISGGAAWGRSPFDFNAVLCGYGIRTIHVDEVVVRGCFFDHLSNSGITIERGADPLIENNAIRDVGQGIDIFFESSNARVVRNDVRDVRVFVGINVEGQEGRGHPAGTIVEGNRVAGAVTAGIDVIEAPGTLVTGNTVSDVSGDHPHYPGYSFGIQAYGSQRTRIVGNRVDTIEGAAIQAGRLRGTGTGIAIGANSSASEVIGNIVRDCSRAACSVTDSNGTAVTTDVLVERNDFDTEIVLEGNVGLRPT